MFNLFSNFGRHLIVVALGRAFFYELAQVLRRFNAFRADLTRVLVTQFIQRKHTLCCQRCCLHQ